MATVDSDDALIEMARQIVQDDIDKALDPRNEGDA